MNPRRANTEPAPHPRQALRPKEAAAALGICERLLWEWTRDHGVPHFRIGKTVLYPVRQLDEWLAARAAEHSTAEAAER